MTFLYHAKNNHTKLYVCNEVEDPWINLDKTSFLLSSSQLQDILLMTLPSKFSCLFLYLDPYLNNLFILFQIQKNPPWCNKNFTYCSIFLASCKHITPLNCSFDWHFMLYPRRSQTSKSICGGKTEFRS